MQPVHWRWAAAAATLTMSAVLPAICFASAAGAADWSKADFSAFTTLGIVQVKLSTEGNGSDQRLDQIKIVVDGKALHIPRGVDLRIQKPHLNSVAVITTRTITCIDDNCPDITGWPISLDLPFGDYAGLHDQESECDFSLLRVDIEADGIAAITTWECVNGRQIEHPLYERDGASDH